MSSYRVISSDSHVVEQGDLWTSRIDSKFKDRAPKLVSFENGDWWVVDEIKLIMGPLHALAGKRFEGRLSLTEEESFGTGRLGGFVPEEHIKDLDADGVYADVIYPSIGLAFFRFDPGTDFLNAIFRAYNDWVAEFCNAYPDRLKSVAMINVEDVPQAAKELERCAKMGMSGAMITADPEGTRFSLGKSYDSPMYEPLWAAAQDMNMPLSIHAATNRPVPGEKISVFHDPRPSLQANWEHWARVAMGDIIFSGVLERYPRLKVGIIEFGLAWVPFFLSQMDYMYTQKPQSIRRHRFKEDMLPSEYFHSNVFISFQEDGLGIRLRNEIGVDNLMWGSDYPHPASTFPKSQEILSEILADCTEEEKAKIVGDNVAKLYNFN